MKICSFLYLFILMVMFACNPKSNIDQQQKPIVSVSIYPQKYFIEQIADTLFDINVMIPPGSNPASYEPSPRQMKNIYQSEVYFLAGHLNFEELWIEKILKSNKEIVPVNTSKGIRFFETNNHHHHDHQHIVDPHVWMSPKRVKTIAKNMVQALDSLYPQYSSILKTNYQNFITEIDSIDQIVGENLKNIPNRHFIIYHPALTYFADDYNLIQHTIEMEGKTPSAIYLKEIVELSKKHDVKKIFIQEQFDKSNADLITNEIGGQVVQINPLGENWKEEVIKISQKLAN